MFRELGEIFNNDGNPMPELFFLVDAGPSAARIAAICAWEATFHNDK